MTTRRHFLQSLLLAPLAGPVLGAEEKRVPVVDSHVHCFAGTDDERFPYHKRAPYRPPTPATPQDLLKAMTDGGVDYAVIVHPEPYQADHRYLEYCLKLAPKRLKGTCLFFADQEGSLAKLKELAGRVSLVAVRIHAYAPERLPPFGKPELKALWKAATDLGLAVQLHFEPRYAAGFEPYIKEFSKTTVILDHLGRLFEGKPEEQEAIVGWSKYPNTIMKISALPPPEMVPPRKIAPIVQGVTKAFGTARLIAGGGWSGGVSGKSYRSERERISGLLAHLSAAQRAAVFGGNAARLFGFGS